MPPEDDPVFCFEMHNQISFSGIPIKPMLTCSEHNTAVELTQSSSDFHVQILVTHFASPVER